MYAVVPDADGGEQELVVHSKLVIVDDRFVRIGSSISTRFGGLDTECDLALRLIVRLHQRSLPASRLIAEHLGTSPALVGETERSDNRCLLRSQRSPDAAA